MAREPAAYKRLLSRKAVLGAVGEYNRIGEKAFFERHGFGDAETYFMRWAGQLYASKAIVGVAFGYQYPDLGPLQNTQLSGGKKAAARHLARLGFEVDGIDADPQDWTLPEVEAAVAEYFRLFDLQKAYAYARKRDFGRAQINIPTRNESAVSRKFSNISAILAEAGLPVLKGFGPLGNKQTLLSAVLYDWLGDNPGTFDSAEHPLPVDLLDDIDALEVEPPTRPLTVKALRERKAVRVDFAERDERNRRLGHAGEQWALEILKNELAAGGRPDLAERVVWVSNDHGDGLGYDIASFNADGLPQVVEVKTTNGNVAAPFVVTANEVRASEEEGSYVLMRIFGFSESPKFYRLFGSLKDSCGLTPVVFVAHPGGN